MARDIKSNPYYTREKLIAECQEAINVYGHSIKLVYVYWDFEHSIGHKYRAPKDKMPAWTRLETGGAWAYIESDCEVLQSKVLLQTKILELLRWLKYSDPNKKANLAQCAKWLSDVSNTATQPPLQTRRCKESFVCSEDGEPFVFFDSSKPPIDDLFKNAVIKTTGDDDALKHFKKYPDCQWTIVWDDVLGAIQMAATVNDDSRKYVPTKPVAKHMGWTQQELCDKANISNTTFRRIRENAEVEASESGGVGQQRRYTPTELNELIKGVLLEKVSGGNFRNRVKISNKWEELENSNKHLNGL